MAWILLIVIVVVIAQSVIMFLAMDDAASDIDDLHKRIEQIEYRNGIHR